MGPEIEDEDFGQVADMGNQLVVNVVGPDSGGIILNSASDLIMAAYGPAKLHPLADKLDYLLLDDDKTSGEQYKYVMASTSNYSVTC